MVADRSSDHLFRLVAHHLRHLRIDVVGERTGIDGPDALLRSLNDAAVALLALLQSDLGIAALGDVIDGAGEVRHAAFGIQDRGHGNFAVLDARLMDVGFIPADGFTGADRFEALLQHARTEWLGDDLIDSFADHLFRPQSSGGEKMIVGKEEAETLTWLHGETEEGGINAVVKLCELPGVGGESSLPSRRCRRAGFAPGCCCLGRFLHAKKKQSPDFRRTRP
jgi:hypothetical protein